MSPGLPPPAAPDPATLSHGRPVPLFKAWHYFVNAARNYDLTPDGNGAIMVKNAGSSADPPSIVVVTNWFDELRAKMHAVGR